MKVILFCQHSYSFGILEPIKKILIQKKYEFSWFITKNLIEEFPFKSENCITDISKLKKYNADAIFVPGNYVPHYLNGLKIQIFHGLAGEKKAHFKIRHFFDVYLTQGPYFTERFNELKNKYKDFEVIETGWSKLDKYNENIEYFIIEKNNLLEKYDAKKILLYAPTFNSNMISAPYLIEEFKRLLNNKDFLLIIKFHTLTSQEIINEYKNLEKFYKNLIINNEPDITKLMIISDQLISDTSSVVYEFQLLDKPVLTFKSQAENIEWENLLEYNNLAEKVNENLIQDKFKRNRQKVITKYHPYNDGKSSLRMVEAVEKIISEKGVPKKRKVSLSRKFKIFKIFTLRNKSNNL